jgi:putative endonuclease
MTYTVYILKSLKDGKHYTGFTTNLSRRLDEHNSGFVKATKSRTPFVLVHTETTMSREEARAKEKFFKSGTGREFRDKLLQNTIPR